MKKGLVYRIDFDGEKFIVISQECENTKQALRGEIDLPAVHIELEHVSNVYPTKKAALTVCDYRNSNMVAAFDENSHSNNFTVKKCIDDGVYFCVPHGEWAFMQRNKFPEPKRCNKCRKARKPADKK